MNEADRIRAMRDEGKIDDAQAKRLLAAVEAIEAAEREESEAQQQSAAHQAASARADEPTAVTPAPAAPSNTAPSNTAPSNTAPSNTARSDAAPFRAATLPPAPTAPPTAPPTSATPSGSGARDRATTMPDVDLTSVVDRWLSLDLFAGSLDVEVDPAATAPRANSSRGDLSVEPTSDGWAIGQSRDEGGTWLERLVSGVKESTIRVTVPPRTGVRMNVKAGDVELHGVPALSGRLMAGDLDATGLRAVDLNVKAGDLDLDLDPLPGRHSVFLAAGDLTLQLPEHADASVHGSVKVGDASAFAPLRSQRRGLIAGDVSGVLGEGRARIELTVGTGDLDVERSHPRGS